MTNEVCFKIALRASALKAISQTAQLIKKVAQQCDLFLKTFFL